MKLRALYLSFCEFSVLLQFSYYFYNRNERKSVGYVQLFLIFSSCGDEIGRVLPEVGSNKVPPTPATTKKRKIPKSTNETTPQVR